MEKSGCHGNWKDKLQSSSSQKLLAKFENNMAQMFLVWSSIKNLKFISIHEKTWLPVDRAHFVIYLYGKLKIFFLDTASPIWKWFDPLYILWKLLRSMKKHGLQGQGLFSLYVYLENFKNLLRYCRSNLKTIWHRCSLGDPRVKWIADILYPCQIVDNCKPWHWFADLLSIFLMPQEQNFKHMYSFECGFQLWP